MGKCYPEPGHCAGPNRWALQKVGTCPPGCHPGAGRNMLHIRLFTKSTSDPGMQVPSPVSLLQHSLSWAAAFPHETVKIPEPSHISSHSQLWVQTGCQADLLSLTLQTPAVRHANWECRRPWQQQHRMECFLPKRAQVFYFSVRSLYLWAITSWLGHCLPC